MTLTELLRPIGVTCLTDGSAYYLYDDWGVLDLDQDSRNAGMYFDIIEAIERVEGLLYDYIEEDLQEAFDCDEDFHGDFEEMQAWMDANQDEIDPESYAWYSEVIDSILNPWNVVDDAPLQED